MTPHATADDLPRVPDAAVPQRVRTLTETHNDRPSSPAAPPASAAGWFASRIQVPDKMQPGSQHLAWLAAQRAIAACELAQKALTDARPGDDNSRAMEFRALAEQYRRISETCAQRAGIVSPKVDDTSDEQG